MSVDPESQTSVAILCLLRNKAHCSQSVLLPGKFVKDCSLLVDKTVHRVALLGMLTCKAFMTSAISVVERNVWAYCPWSLMVFIS